MLEIQQTRDTVIDKLTSTEGQELEITANLTAPAQIDAIMDSYVSMFFNSSYGRQQAELLLRLTDSWKGRCREDLTGIGKVSDFNQGWSASDNAD